MPNHLQAPFCLATDGDSIFGAGFAFNLGLNMTSSTASTFPDWLVLTQSTSTQIPLELESSPFYNVSMFTQMDSLNWTIIFSIPRVAVNLFPNISYAFSCGLASDGYFALRAQPYPDMQIQLTPSFLIRLPTANSTRFSVIGNNISGGLHYNDNDPNYSSPLLSSGMWSGSAWHEPSSWYSQPGSAAALVAANDIITANDTEDGSAGWESTDPGEWVHIWSTCATDMSNLHQIEIQFAVSSNGMFPTQPQTKWELQNLESLGPRVPGSRCPIYIWNSTLFVLGQFNDHTRVSALPLRKVLAQGRYGLETISILHPYQTTDPIKAVEFPPQLDCTSNDKSMISSFGGTIHVLCFNGTLPSIHLMFNSKTNIGTTRPLDHLHYFDSLDWPLGMRPYSSMSPLYVNAHGYALSILVSRGYFPQLKYSYFQRHSLPSVTISWNWTAAFTSYNVHSQGGQNFSAFLDSPDIYNYSSDDPTDNSNLSVSQVVFIVIFSTLLPWLIFGAVRCCKCVKKKKSVGNEYSDSNISNQSIDKNKNRSRNKKIKGKQGSKKSARTKSKAWGIASWKRSRKHENSLAPETEGSKARSLLSDQAETTGDYEEYGIAQGSEEPPGSKICESEGTHAFTTATGSILGTPAATESILEGPAATALGVTAIHGGLEDARSIPLLKRNSSRVSDSRRNSSSIALGDDQPLGPVDQSEARVRFTSPTEFIPLARHRLWSVVTSLSNHASLPQHQSQDQQHQSPSPSVLATVVEVSSTPSASEAHAALTGITIERTRPLPFLTGIAAAPLVTLPMSAISSSEHSPEPNQPRWARTNSTRRAHLSVSTIQSTGPSSFSPPATPIIASPSAPPHP